MLAKVHVAKKQLGLTDDDYRAGLLRITGCDSAKACTDQQLVAVLDEMRRLGWKDAPGAPVRRISGNPQVRMIHAIWAEMRALGLVSGGDAALNSFVQRQTKGPKTPAGISAPEFLTPELANKVIEGLKAWRARLTAARKGETNDA